MNVDDNALRAFLAVIHGQVRDQLQMIREVPGDYEGNRHRQTVVSVLSTIGEAVAAAGMAQEATPAPSETAVMHQVAKLCCNPVIPDRVTPCQEDWERAKAIIDYLRAAGVITGKFEP